MPRIKICGINRAEDALAAAHCGADAIGLVFYERSPRHVSIAQAAQLAAALPPFVSVVGLFVNAAEAFVREALVQVPLDLLQFHGDESPEFMRANSASPISRRSASGQGWICYNARPIFAAPEACCWMPMWKAGRAAPVRHSTGH